MNIAELAERTGAQLEGDAALEISSAAGLDIAGPGQVTFLANPRYTGQVQTTRAAAIYLSDKMTTEGRADLAVLRVRDPYLAYTRALRLFHPAPVCVPALHPTAVIDPTAEVSSQARIGAHVVIGSGCRIAAGTHIFPNVTIYDDVTIGPECILHAGVTIRAQAEIGARVIIHNNSVIGSDGFGYAKDEEKRWLKIPQTGRVVLEDDVEIGAGVTIDCASVGETRIKRGAKIDNQVQIGHSCIVGEDALLCAQVGLAGSSIIGQRVILAGQVGVAGHLTIGDDAVLTAKSATSHNVEPGQVISGIPGFANKDWLRATAAYRRLGDMARTVRQLAARLERLERS